MKKPQSISRGPRFSHDEDLFMLQTCADLVLSDIFTWERVLQIPPLEVTRKTDSLRIRVIEKLIWEKAEGDPIKLRQLYPQLTEEQANLVCDTWREPGENPGFPAGRLKVFNV